MKEITIEMPLVSACSVELCGYNLNHQCHAKAITVGDSANPGCDTFFKADKHSKETKRVAGVGACKVSECKFNEDFECAANNISVGFARHKINCLTFTPRS